MKTLAQQFADIANHKVRVEFASSARVVGRWFGGHSLEFADGSVATVRNGGVESPRPSQIEWTEARRSEWDV